MIERTQKTKGVCCVRSKPTLCSRRESIGWPSVEIALVGTAYCFVDADLTPIEIGDLIDCHVRLRVQR